MYEGRIKDLKEQAGRALHAAREAGKKIAEADGPPAADAKETFDKAKTEFDRLMAEIQKLEGLEALEREHEQFTRPAPGSQVPHAGEPPNPKGAEEAAKQRHRDSYEAFIRAGADAARAKLVELKASPTEMHLLLGTTGDLGGFLVPPDQRAVVLRDLPGVGVLRRLARVERTGRDSLIFPGIVSATGTRASKYTSGFTGDWKAQAATSGGTAPTTQNQPRFSQITIPVHIWRPDVVELSQQLIEDSVADVVGILEELIAETFGLDEDNEYINGTGVGRPEGLLAASVALTTVVTGSAAALAYDGLVDLWAKLPAQYRANGTWVMNSLAYGAVLKLKDAQNFPIISPNTTPGTLWGRPIAFDEFMPDVAANATPIIFGDFRQYLIADRQEVRVQRLVERYAPNVGFLPTARVGGQVARKDAFRVQKVSV